MTTIDAIREDLAKIVDQAMWAHGIGYSKAGRGLDAEHGADLSRSEQEREAGPTYDLEIGEHNARVAYQAAVEAVSKADITLAALLAKDGLTFQPAVVKLTAYAFPSMFRRCAGHVSWRLDRIEDHDKELTKIRSSFDRTLRGLSKALDHGTATSPLRESLCRTCGIRERGNKKTECDVCGQYRFRHGEPRPTRLDTDTINEARKAQAKRRARDEDFGVA